jgi:hypothetical protein
MPHHQIDPERHDRSHISEDRIVYFRLDLRSILIRENKADTVFAQLPKHCRDQLYQT